jgi:hypothetical protein
VRWLTRLDPADEAAYRAVVTPLVGRIERSLGPEVIANRARPSGSGWRLAAWRPARDAWRAAIGTAVASAPAGSVFAIADVRECYPSIGPATLAAVLGPSAHPVIALLRTFADAGVVGLPIGPEPSAVLANAVLARLDVAIARGGAQHLRWVDDLVLWGDAAGVRTAIDALAAAAAVLRLDLNERKTRLLDRDEVAPHRLSPTVRVRAGTRRAPIIATP